jgi:hypothetical protein
MQWTRRRRDERPSKDEQDRGPNLIRIGPGSDLVGAAVKEVEEQSSGGDDVDVGECSTSDAISQQKGGQCAARPLSMDWSGATGGTVEDGVVESSETQLEVEKAVDFFLEDLPRVGIPANGQSLPDAVGVLLHQMVAHSDQKVVPGGEVPVEASLGGGRRGGDVFHPAVDGTALAQDAYSSLEEFAPALVRTQSPAPTTDDLSGRRSAHGVFPDLLSLGSEGGPL